MTTRSAWGLGLATVTDDGNTLDVWYPRPILGDEPADGDADLLTVATLPAARRRGVATAMIAHLLRRARRAGCTAVLLEVRASNAGAQALYRRLGFAPIGRRRRYYLAPVEDALVMRADTGVRHGAGADSASSAGRAGAVGAEAAADSGAAGRADHAVVGRPPHLSD